MVLPHLGCQGEIGAQKRSAQLSDEFFHRITCIAKALAPEIAVQAAFVTRPMRAFVNRRGVPTPIGELSY